MLARIDAVNGVAESRVSWDGRWFLLELDAGADVESVTDAATAVLGEGSSRLSGKAEADAVAGYRRGERWLNREQTVELSRDEARQQAAGFAAAVAQEVGLDHEAAQRLQAALLAELERAFQQAHAEGGGVDRLQDQWPEARRRFEERLAGFLDPEQLAAVVAILDRELQD